MTGPSATPAPSWPGREPEAGDRARRADRGQVVGQPRAQAGPRRGGRELRQAREQARGPGDHRVGDRRVDARVEAAPLARGADEHVALPGGLHDRRDLQAALRARDRAQVGAVDDLVADHAPARAPRAGRAGPCAAPAAAAGRRARRAPRSRARRRSRPPARRSPRRPPAARRARARSRRPRSPRGPRRRRPPPRGERSGDRPRVALQVVGEEARAVHGPGQLGLELAHLVGADQPRARDRHAFQPRRLAGPRRLVGMHDQRALAADPRDVRRGAASSSP